MKNYTLLLAIAVSIMLGGCNREKVETLTSENTTLQAENKELESTLNEYLETFNAIEANLAEIREREDQINLATGDVENPGAARKSIVADMEAINKLMAENRTKIEELTGKLDNSSVRIREFNRLVSNLQTRVEDKNKEVAEMQQSLEKLSSTNQELQSNLAYLRDTLSTERSLNEELISTQKTTIESQIERINTGYVATGSFKELKDGQVVTREGGILGIGAVEKMRDDFDPSAFSKIDISSTTEIPLEGKKVELITVHPTGSYTVEHNENDELEKLIITNPDEFWKSSKYLVAVVN